MLLLKGSSLVLIVIQGFVKKGPQLKEDDGGMGHMGPKTRVGKTYLVQLLMQCTHRMLDACGK